MSPSVTQKSTNEEVDYEYTSKQDVAVNDNSGLDLNEDQRTELTRLMSMHRDVTERTKELEGERLSLKTQILEITNGQSVKIDNWRTWTVPIVQKRMFTKKQFTELYGGEWVKSHTNVPAEDEEKVRFYVKYAFKN